MSIVLGENSPQMKIVRYQDAGTGAAAYGIVENGTVYAGDGDIFAGLTKGAEVGSYDSLDILAPIVPGKVMAIGMNYLKHVKELDASREVPTEPVVFMKPQSAIIGPGKAIELAYPENRTDYEAELVIVIGKTAYRVSEDEALDYVLGYTVGNDVSDRIQQHGGIQWIRGKGYNTFLPLGPVIETELDPGSAQVRSRLNGELRQDDNTSGLIFSVPFLIQFLSDVMTLNPGDIIMTGTPHNVGAINAGDTIEVEVEGIGVLSNPVVNRD
jgi:2-keto-4-pentenoate hydratase/2-oxohepta-3-ene-1,7-dioic acid hydratase in catechol pathway